MNTVSNPPVSVRQKIIQLPLIRVISGFLLIFLPVLIGQPVIMSALGTGLWRSFLMMAFMVSVTFAGYYVLVHFVERRKMTELEPSGATRETVMGVLLGTLFSAGIMAVLALAGTYAVLGTSSVGVLLTPLFTAIRSAVWEEFLFRGVLFGITERSLGSWRALLISAVLFGGMHLLNENATIMGAISIMLTAGITLGAAYMLTRRLWLVLGFHFAWNFTQMGIFASTVSGNEATGILRATLTGPDWLTGGAFGVEASIVTVAFGLAFGILLLWRARVKGNFIRPT